MEVDALAVGAHPDDVEVGVGGLVHKLTRTGRRVGILDLTEGEMSTRGSTAERKREAAAAADLLGVAHRENAGLPDGALANTPEFQLRVVRALRTFRPRVLLAPMDEDRHPDHEAAHALVRDANYVSGLHRVDTGQEPHRASVVYFYRVYRETTLPQLIVDISDDFEAKLAALRAYPSQFFNPDYPGKATFVSSRAFWDFVTTKASYWGAHAGVHYGEALYARGPMGVAFPPGLEGGA